MQQDWPNPYPSPSYPFPFALPSVDPDASPTIAVTVSCAWLPYIRGALVQLTQQATWKSSDPAAVLLAQQRAMTLISLFEECSGSSLPFACNFDFGVSQLGWDLLPTAVFGDNSPFVRGVYTGSAWENASFTNSGLPGVSQSGIYIRKTFAPCTLVLVRMDYNLVKGDFDSYGGADNGIIIRSGGSTVASQLVPSNSDPDGTGKHIDWTGSLTADEIWMFVDTQTSTGSPGDVGTALITSGDVDGSGIAPC